jgi:hypothetical protein
VHHRHCEAIRLIPFALSSFSRRITTTTCRELFATSIASSGPVYGQSEFLKRLPSFHSSLLHKNILIMTAPDRTMRPNMTSTDKTGKKVIGQDPPSTIKPPTVPPTRPARPTRRRRIVPEASHAAQPNFRKSALDSDEGPSGLTSLDCGPKRPKPKPSPGKPTYKELEEEVWVLRYTW